MLDDGCETRPENWGGTRVMVGYRADFRLRWLATKLHLFTVVGSADAVSRDAVEAFTRVAMDYALARKGDLRGMQSGVGVLAALVSTTVEPAAAAWAADRQRLRFACIARPVVVDLARGVVSCYRGTPALGWVYSAHFRTKLDLYFPRT
jgi:hypothetical protein